jgi:hypothetical protein
MTTSNPALLPNGIWATLAGRISAPVGEVLADTWKHVRWNFSEGAYLRRVRENLSTTRLLGNPRPIEIDKIYSDVYVLPTPSAKRIYSIEHIEDLSYAELYSSARKDKIKALDIVEQHSLMYVLGKPGAGKTTFLKYLAIQAAEGHIAKTPVFVSLKDLVDSKLALSSYIEQQFDICNFPSAAVVIEALLEAGQMLVLFDGLDEVTQNEDKRKALVSQIVDFSKQYRANQICVTCRTAADEFTFEQFTYVEIADFDETQQDSFIRKWHAGSPDKLATFLEEWHRPGNSGLRDLATTPLLLALLCLAFDETLKFPLRRVDLYKEAIDALLRRWDASRNVMRDSAYKDLSPGRKEQLLARLAAETFQRNQYAFRPNAVAEPIKAFLSSLPAPESHADVDVESILRAVEAQHGLIVERARGIYSFSHLTFHEYLCATYIVANVERGSVTGLLTLDKVTASRWREVILLTASLLHSAEGFLDLLVKRSQQSLSSRPLVGFVLREANLLASQRGVLDKLLEEKPVKRAVDFQEGVDDEAHSAATAANFNPVLDLLDVLQAHTGRYEELPIRRTLALLLMLEGRVPGKIPDELGSFASDLFHHCRLQELLAECLRVASVTDRRKYEMRLLAPT